MSRLFTLTVFASAALLFTVEPLIGKALLPLAGGTPAVWTTCLLFFQAALLAGYAYAHAISDRLSPKAQVLLQIAVVAIPALALPMAVHPDWFAGSSYPRLTLLSALARTVGLPFFALTTTAPLLQRWFATANPKGNPYPLYAASNAGSLLGLAAYPFLIEPGLGLTQQRQWWSIGYATYAVMIAACGLFLWKVPAQRVTREETKSESDPWVLWLLLSFAPSSLLMSVTTAITTDISPVPLLWVVPLALYLLTFIVAFAGRQIIPHKFVVLFAPIASLALFFVILNKSQRPWALVLAIHLGVFFVMALACHGELARLKPPPKRLTRFFLLLSVGGVLGGLLNAVIAPLVFQKIGLAEYPLVLALAVGLMPNRPRQAALKGILEPTGLSALIYPLIVGAVTATAVLVARVNDWNGQHVGGILLGIPLIFIYFLVDRPRRFATALAFVWLASLLYVGSEGPRLFFERNFFGMVKVSAELAEIRLPSGSANATHIMVHGSTLHGRQAWKDDRGVGNVPLSYYGKQGPIGDVFQFLATKDAPPPVAVCGLGAGSLAAYAKPKQSWTFYEIDPSVVSIAQNPQLFSFLSDNFPNRELLKIEIGDARQEMTRAPNSYYGLIVLDAFSSDSIPVHLLTKEAIELYLQKLAPGGLLAFHISNRYLDLKPVLARAAYDLKLARPRIREDRIDEHESKDTGVMSSDWVVIGRTEADLGPLTSGNWRFLPPFESSFRLWTDDYSNILRVFQFSNE